MLLPPLPWQPPPGLFEAAPQPQEVGDLAPPQDTAGSPNEVGGLSPPHETAGSAQEVGGLAPHPGTLQLHPAMPTSPSPLQLAQLVGDGTARWVLQGASLFHNRRADGLGWVAVFSMARCLRPESPGAHFHLVPGTAHCGRGSAGSAVLVRLQAQRVHFQGAFKVHDMSHTDYAWADLLVASPLHAALHSIARACLQAAPAQPGARRPYVRPCFHLSFRRPRLGEGQAKVSQPWATQSCVS